MKKSRILGTLLVIALVLGIFIFLRPLTVYRIFHPASRQEVIERVFKNQELFDVMTNSPQVTAQRLHPKSDFDPNPDLLSSYTRDMPVKLTAGQAQQIKDLLQTSSSYLWDVRRNCLPDYGVVYNFQSSGHTVRAAFCFKCNIIGIFDGDNDASNSINFISLFDPMRGRMLTLSKALLPDDREMQALQ